MRVHACGLASRFAPTGGMAQAARRTVDSRTVQTSKHIVAMCLNVIRVGIETGNYVLPSRPPAHMHRWIGHTGPPLRATNRDGRLAPLAPTAGCARARRSCRFGCGLCGPGRALLGCAVLERAGGRRRAGARVQPRHEGGEHAGSHRPVPPLQTWRVASSMQDDTWNTCNMPLHSSGMQRTT
jgi:hypothetical protein